METKAEREFWQEVMKNQKDYPNLFEDLKRKNQWKFQQEMNQ